MPVYIDLLISADFSQILTHCYKNCMHFKLFSKHLLGHFHLNWLVLKKKKKKKVKIQITIAVVPTHMPRPRASQISLSFLLSCLFISFQAPSQALAQSVLAELPQQVASFFSLFKLKPPHEPSPS